jgi:glucose-1-phosphate adenylyltransferase
MGIYVFNKKKLFDYLVADAADSNSANDFGKNIIPNMLAAGEKMMAYPFEGYWKDVGTIQSLWEANMDLLGDEPVLNVSDESWRIYSRHHADEPQFVGKTAVIENSSITEGCEIHGTVKNCVLGAGVRIMYGAYVKDSVIMGDTVIGEGATVNYAILDEGVDVGAGTKVGAPRESATDITVIGAGVKIPSGTTVQGGQMISEL